jgi:hypothetical protein
VSTINQAIAKTAIDNDGFMHIAERVKSGDAGAQVALSSLLSLLGQSALSRPSLDDRQTYNPPTNYREIPPNPRDYPPSRLREYVTELRDRHIIFSEEQIETWITIWNREGDKEEVFMALTQAIGEGLRLRNYDSIFELALQLYGREKAYPWLLRAHIEDMGWNRYWTDKSKATNTTTRLSLLRDFGLRTF